MHKEKKENQNYFNIWIEIFNFKKIITSASITFSLINRLLFALIISFAGYFLDSNYLLFFLLSVPQIFRHSFEKIFEAQFMR
jgi:hypothetical protein